jgi:DNA topoisomerase IB
VPRLRRTNPGQPGITRRRRGKGWAYLNSDGSPVTDMSVRRRIDSLVIPPAWRDVWITPFANGHLQAVGTDAAGRRQYLYHPDWHNNRSRQKHQRVLALGAALPRARSVVARDLTAPELTRERLLATAFRLLDAGHFRIGGEIYSETNGSYGLSTLRREHVRRQHGVLVFEYVAKSGVAHTERIDDPILLDTVGALLRRRGGDIDELLVYRDGRSWRKVSSDDINAYVKAAVGLDVSAKDFRTWHGTVLGSVAMATEYLMHPADRPWSKTGLNKAIRRSVVAVAETLGNTPAVCRGSYINPQVIELFRKGVTVERAVCKVTRTMDRFRSGDDPGGTVGLLPTIAAAPSVESAVLKMLAD